MIQRTRPLKELLDDTEACRAAMQDSIDKDIERHRLLGHSIWVWRDGGVVEVPAEEIPPLESRRDERAK
jgi:hypothetical protein